MKRASALVGFILGAVTAGATQAATLVYDFYFDPYGTTPNSWGTLTVSYVDADTLSFKYEGLDPYDPSVTETHEATGFGFNFNPDNLTLTVSNPDDASSTDDRDDLDWILGTNLDAIPNPANSTTLTKADFWFAVTEGNAGNFSPPGILSGEWDLFFVNGFSGLTDTTVLSDIVALVGVRIQTVADDASGTSINGGSLFLVGTPDDDNPADTDIPEPGSLALFAAGLLAAGLTARRRRRGA